MITEVEGPFPWQEALYYIRKMANMSQMNFIFFINYTAREHGDGKAWQLWAVTFQTPCPLAMEHLGSLQARLSHPQI